MILCVEYGLEVFESYPFGDYFKTNGRSDRSVSKDSRVQFCSLLHIEFLLSVAPTLLEKIILNNGLEQEISYIQILFS